MGSEACDDRNLFSNDGCNSVCQVEQGWTCPGTPSICTTKCGDGIKAGPEECDSPDENACTKDCHLTLQSLEQA